MNYLKINRFSHHLQVDFKQLNRICHRLYNDYAPAELANRRNINQCSVSDSISLAILIGKAEIGIESPRRSSRFFSCMSHSRFNRRARMLLLLLYLIRHALNQEIDLSGKLTIVDSFPVPVCQPIRNRRIKIFRGYADIGYKATKKIFYYGFKVHALVSDNGYILNYTVTKASVHDTKEVPELVNNTGLSNQYLLGDEGYIGKKLADQLKQTGYILWTPHCKNMKDAKKHNDNELMAIRRTLDSDFSLLTYYNAENNRTRSLIGFQERLETAILAYCPERFN